MAYEFEGKTYEKKRDMQRAGRERYVACLEAGMNYTQAAKAVGVSKRTSKVWRNGRTRTSGRVGRRGRPPPRHGARRPASPGRPGPDKTAAACRGTGSPAPRAHRRDRLRPERLAALASWAL